MPRRGKGKAKQSPSSSQPSPSAAPPSVTRSSASGNPLSSGAPARPRYPCTTSPTIGFTNQGKEKMDILLANDTIYAPQLFRKLADSSHWNWLPSTTDLKCFVEGPDGLRALGQLKPQENVIIVYDVGGHSSMTAGKKAAQGRGKKRHKQARPAITSDTSWVALDHADGANHSGPAYQNPIQRPPSPQQLPDGPQGNRSTPASSSFAIDVDAFQLTEDGTPTHNAEADNPEDDFLS